MNDDDDDKMFNWAPAIEPPADLRQAAMVTRQMYLSYTEAGFTPDQAMQLVLQMLGNARPS